LYNLPGATAAAEAAAYAASLLLPTMKCGKVYRGLRVADTLYDEANRVTAKQIA
jgi:hypothetical protein